MRKKSLLTKVVALGATATLLASTTAFAGATYSTRTLYKAGDNTKVEVATTVSGLTVDDEVTYLAGTTDDPVYINQYTADATTYTFKYTTTKAKLTGSPAIKMAKADSAFVSGEAINAGDGESATVPASQEFTFNVKIDNDESVAVKVNPRDVAGITSATTINLAGVSVDVSKIATATLNNTDVKESITSANDGINLTISSALTTIDESTLAITGATSADLVITLNTTPVVPSVTYKEGLKSNSFTATISGTTEGSTETITNARMFVIYGIAENCDEYGVAVSYEGAFEKDATNGYECYKAIESDATSGEFGVAFVDDTGVETKTAYARTYYTKDGTTVLGDKLITVSFE